MGHYRYRIDNNDMSQGTMVSQVAVFTPPSSLSEDTHVLYVQERDSAGNWSTTGSFPIRVDITPPAAPVFDSTPYSPLNTLRPNWTWRGGGGGSGDYRVRLDNANLSSEADTIRQSSFKPAVDLSEGLHTLFIQEKDSAGNWSESSSRQITLMTSSLLGNAGISSESLRSRGFALAISSMGEKYIAYNDREVPQAGTFIKRFNGTNWDQVGDVAKYGGITWPNSFSINPNGIPYLAVTDSNEIGSVLKFHQGQWQVVGGFPLTSDRVGEPSISFTRNGYPIVAFRDGGRNNRTTVMKFNGLSWDTLGTRGFSSGFSIYFCIAVNNADIPIISYLEASPIHPARLNVRKFNSLNSNWDAVGNFPYNSLGNGPFSMVLDTKDSLYLALTSHESEGAGEIFKFDGLSWKRIGEPIFPAGSGSAIVLAIDSTGRKYAAYLDIASGNKGVVKANIGGHWTPVKQPGQSPLIRNFSFAISLALDRHGIPHMLFADPLVGNRATVLKTGFEP